MDQLLGKLEAQRHTAIAGFLGKRLLQKGHLEPYACVTGLAPVY